ncbi:MAG: CBS domain-containing protein [Gammaproteobacteria bacterium]|nr:CBS domain-containing protein [Gammaproteobacteria bacterium]
MNGDTPGNTNETGQQPVNPIHTADKSHSYLSPTEGPLRSLPQRPTLAVAPTTSLRTALLQLNQSGGDAIIVVDKPSNLPLGIVTLKDLVYGMAQHGNNLDEPIATLMTGAPFTLPADAPAHRATVLMTKKGVRHVLLVEPDGSLCNLVSRSDLFGLRGGGAEVLAEAVTEAMDVDAMADAAAAIRKRGAELFTAGMGVENICEWMSALNDLVVIRIIELIEDEFDLPAVPWCWLVFGSEGRLEQTFSTDQDNGLIFLPGEEGETESLREAFLPFARVVNRGLDACGFTLCKGGIMAGNPLWCLSLSEWKGKFRNWMGNPDPMALMHSTIFFDFRPIYGTYELADDLRNWLIPLPPEHPRFLRAMAEEALTCDPPLNWIGGFVYDGGPEHPHSIDLKLHGARPFVDAARIWGLTHGIWATSTGDRLRSVGAAQKRELEETAAEVEAFHLIQRFRIRQQLTDEDPEDPNRVDPATLPDLNRLMLKEAFKQAKKLQLRLKLEHGL